MFSHIMGSKRLFQLFLSSVLLVSVSSFEVKLTSNSPVLIGEPLIINATLVDEDGAPAKGRFCFTWKFKGLTKASEDSPAFSSWVIPIDTRFRSGTFTGTVDVADVILGYCPFAKSTKFHIRITDTITGNLELQQRNETVTTKYIYTNVPTNHTIVVDSSQWSYVLSKATSVQVTWLLDCVNISTSGNLSLLHTYKADSSRTRILAVIDANFIPPTTTTTTTTTQATTTTTTTTSTSTTEKPTTTTSPPPPPVNSTTTPATKSKISKREAKEQDVSTTTSSPFSDSCAADYVKQEPGHVYGFFQRDVEVKTPISNLSITGNTWGKKGEHVQLHFKCGGSPPFTYCMHLCRGTCNATGHEECIFPLSIDICDFEVGRYVYDDKPVTMIVILKNDVSKVVKPTVINIFVDPGNQGQLSVILVPVAFILLALTAVIYGIAYYVQNRRIAVVEVADFNFGDDVGSDMEYKSFRRRLVESVHDAVNEMRQNRSGVPTDLTGDSSVGYGSMK